MPASHHYDNDSGGAPIYSTVKPRIKASAPPIYDIAAPTNQRQGEGPLALSNNGEYQLLPGNSEQKTNDVIKVRKQITDSALFQLNVSHRLMMIMKISPPQSQT